MQIQTKQSTFKNEYLGNLISLEYGSSLTSSNRKGNKYPVFGSNGIVGYHDQYLIKGPGVIVGRKGSIGEVTWSDRDFWAIDTTYYIKLKSENISLKWIYYLLLQKNLRDLNSATGIPGLNRNDVYKVTCFCPSLKEQQKIALILSNIDELILKTEQIIEQLQNLKKGLINKLIIKGIDVKENKIQKIPENYQYNKLSEVIKINPSYKVERDKEYEFVEMAAINENTKSISYRIQRKLSSGYAIFKNNDTIFARITPCTENGKICLVKDFRDYGLGSTELIVLSPGNNILPQFLCYYCQTDKVRNYAISQMGGATGRQRVPYKVFNEDLFILLPPKEIQQKIVNCIASIEELIKLKNLEKEKIGNLKKGLMQQLLTGKIRVKV